MAALIYHERSCKVFSTGVCSCTANVEICEGQSRENLEKAKLLSVYFRSLARLLEEWEERRVAMQLVDGLKRLLDQMQEDLERLLKPAPEESSDG